MAMNIGQRFLGDRKRAVSISELKRGRSSGTLVVTLMPLRCSNPSA